MELQKQLAEEYIPCDITGKSCKLRKTILVLLMNNTYEYKHQIQDGQIQQSEISR